MSRTLLHSSSRRAPAALAALLAGAVLAACGGGDAGSDSAAGSGTAASGDTGDFGALTVMRSPGGQFESTVIADEQGYFEDAGFDTTIEVGTGDPTAIIPLLLNDQVQFGMIDGAAAIRAAAEGVPIKVVSAIQSANADFPSDGLLAPPGSPITSLEDLEGATIGTSSLGGTPQTVNNIALEQAGVDPATVEYVQLPTDALISSAEAGQVDAILFFANFYQQALQAGFTALTEGSAQYVPNIPQVVWAASDQYIAENPDAVTAFVGAMDQANQFANENQDEIRAVDTELTKLPADYIANRDIAPLSSEINTDALQSFAEAMNDQGFIDSVPSTDDILWADAPRT